MYTYIYIYIGRRIGKASDYRVRTVLRNVCVQCNLKPSFAANDAQESERKRRQARERQGGEK